MLCNHSIGSRFMLKQARTAGVAHDEIHSFAVKTLYDANQNIEIVIATGSGRTIVAIPQSCAREGPTRTRLALILATLSPSLCSTHSHER